MCPLIINGDGGGWACESATTTNSLKTMSPRKRGTGPSVRLVLARPQPDDNNRHGQIHWLPLCETDVEIQRRVLRAAVK